MPVCERFDICNIHLAVAGGRKSEKLLSEFTFCIAALSPSIGDAFLNDRQVVVVC